MALADVPAIASKHALHSTPPGPASCASHLAHSVRSPVAFSDIVTLPSWLQLQACGQANGATATPSRRAARAAPPPPVTSMNVIAGVAIRPADRHDIEHAFPWRRWPGSSGLAGVRSASTGLGRRPPTPPVPGRLDADDQA